MSALNASAAIVVKSSHACVARCPSVASSTGGAGVSVAAGVAARTDDLAGGARLGIGVVACVADRAGISRGEGSAGRTQAYR